jgi:hypothetical protein
MACRTSLAVWLEARFLAKRIGQDSLDRRCGYKLAGKEAKG